MTQLEKVKEVIRNSHLSQKDKDECYKALDESSLQEGRFDKFKNSKLFKESSSGKEAILKEVRYRINWNGRLNDEMTIDEAMIIIDAAMNEYAASLIKENEELKRKLEIYRRETQKCREFVAANTDVGFPTQPLWDAIHDYLMTTKASNEAKDKEIEKLNRFLSGKYDKQAEDHLQTIERKQLEYWKQLAEAQKEYIKFLDNESSKYVQFAGIHGMKVPDEVFKRGQQFRDQISNLEIQLTIFNPQ